MPGQLITSESGGPAITCVFLGVPNQAFMFLTLPSLCFSLRIHFCVPNHCSVKTFDLYLNEAQIMKCFCTTVTISKLDVCTRYQQQQTDLQCLNESIPPCCLLTSLLGQ